MDPLDDGTYYFQCDAHPTTMFGTLAVVKAQGQVGPRRPRRCRGRS